MRNFRTFIGVITVFFLCSCSQKQTALFDDSDIQTITITNDNTIPINDLISHLEYIKLEDTRQPIGSIDRLLMTDEYIIIADEMKSKSVFIFNKKGESIAVINRQGRGPQEYIDLSHVTITPDNKSIAVLDNRAKKVLFYDMSGRFVSGKPVGFWLDGFEYLDDNHLVCTTYGLGKNDPALASIDYNEDLIFFTDEKFNIKGGAFPNIYNNKQYHAMTPHTKKFNNVIYTNPSFCDTIYQISGDGIKALYHIDMTAINGFANPRNDINDEKMGKMFTERAIFSGRYIDNGQFTLLSFSIPPQRMVTSYLFSKNSKNVYRLPYDPNNVLYSNILYSTLTTYDNVFVSAIPAFRLLIGTQEIERKDNPLFDGLSEESNPVLFLYKAKEPA